MKSIKRIRKATPPHTARVIELEIGGKFGKFAWNSGWGGTTIPFPFVTLMMFWTVQPQPDGNPDPLIRVHEWTHVKQNEANRFWFVSWVRYLWQDIIHIKWSTVRSKGIYAAYLEAYYANKYEAEAYVVEDLARENGLPDWAK